LILKNNFPEITKISELLTPEVIQELKAFSNIEPTTGIICATIKSIL